MTSWSPPAARPRRSLTEVAVAVFGPDPLTTEAIRKLLGVEAARLTDAEPPDVTVVADDRFAPTTLRCVQAAAALGAPIVLLTTDVREHSLLSLVSHGVAAVLDRATTTGADLADAVLSSANGAAVMSPQLLGSLVAQIRGLQSNVLEPLGYTGPGLSTREVEILRMLAEGVETREIAKTLVYSESTVKKDLASIIGRFNLRNRTQAVAFALRAGVL
ncbi:response regulator transcription factor [Amycolatopsis rhabdoformis]|uniref:Response regulator transcription factor n=1 Tax=Amycolatopsis rhabdoformis TaxID=1448059 RepID=A0ABZ1HXH0_9PSEU|nr:response regulator transcription factor [Amycolatopsis rhabdoformis]WSE26252.1 response regulator transcription factor [Amycolatopsis rhabdoformis]